MQVPALQQHYWVWKQHIFVSSGFSTAKGGMSVLVITPLISHTDMWRHLTLPLSFKSSEIKGVGAKSHAIVQELKGKGIPLVAVNSNF